MWDQVTLNSLIALIITSYLYSILKFAVIYTILHAPHNPNEIINTDYCYCHIIDDETEI